MKRTFLYHEKCREGKIFTDENEYLEAIEDGWVEAPQDIKKRPPGRPSLKDKSNGNK